MLTVDLGQSGSRISSGQALIYSTRGKLAGEPPLSSLRAVFESIEKLQADTVALSCTGFRGVVTDPQPFLALCNEFFGASKVAVMDDGLAGFIGALGGGNGVVLSIGGGVVSVGRNDTHFAHRDGLESTFGDEGGGFWLGKLGLTRALGIRQGRGDDQILLEILKDQMEKIGLDCLANIYGESPSDIPEDFWNQMRAIINILYWRKGGRRPRVRILRQVHARLSERLEQGQLPRAAFADRAEGLER